MKNAFTTIELLVAMSLFVIIVTVATGSFVMAMRSQRALVALMAVNDNASLAIEQMAREIRTGTNFPVSGNDCNSDTSITFINYLGHTIIYSLDSGVIKKTDNGTSNLITASNVDVQDLKFCVLHNVDYPARVTITIKAAVPGTGSVGVRGISSNLQTTISARNLE